MTAMPLSRQVDPPVAGGPVVVGAGAGVRSQICPWPVAIVQTAVAHFPSFPELPTTQSSVSKSVASGWLDCQHPRIYNEFSYNSYKFKFPL